MSRTYTKGERTFTRRTPGERIKRMIEMGIDTTEKAEAALAVLSRIAPETMTQEQVAARWPRVVARLITESLGYFTPRSAANAVLAYKLKRPFGCEYYCFSAGFERDGWPRDPKEYDRKLRDVGEQKIRRSVSCQRFETSYDMCATCHVERYMHPAEPNPTYEHTFVNEPIKHQGCRHMADSYMRDYQYALKLVLDLAGGAANPPSLLASWF